MWKVYEFFKSCSLLLPRPIETWKGRMKYKGQEIFVQLQSLQGKASTPPHPASLGKDNPQVPLLKEAAP